MGAIIESLAPTRALITIKPAIGQFQMHFLTQASLGTDAIAVADDQHPDHPFGIDRGTPGVAVVVCQVLSQFAWVEAAFDATQEMILGNMLVEAERIERSILTTCLTPHHR